MTWELIIVLALLGFAIASFLWERISTDFTAFLVFTVLAVMSTVSQSPNLPNISELLTVFSNPAPLAIAALFIVSAALEKSGVLDNLGTLLEGMAKLSYLKVMLLVILSVAGISAFINNTPIVVIFVPVVLSLSRKMKIPPSKMLIPLSYASMLGGMCTLMGTSTNILASSLLKAEGLPGFSMFELAKVGVPLLIAGTIYMVTTGWRLLPDRETLTSMLSEEERREYITTAFIGKNSPIAGKTLSESGILKGHSIRVLEIIRSDVAVMGEIKQTPLREGDRLVLACRPSGFALARSLEGFSLDIENKFGVETIAAHEGSIVEGVVGPRSKLIGTTIGDINFRQRYRMIPLAIHRGGINMRSKFENTRLEFGDTLLLMGTDQAREELRKDNDILLLDRAATPSRTYRKQIPIVLITLVVMVATVSLGIMPIEASAIGACAIIFLSGLMSPKEGYASVDWSLLILIYGMLALGMSMEVSGASQMLAVGLTKLVNGATSIGIPEEVVPYLMLAAVYGCTTLATEFLSNNATVVLMVPIALGMGSILGVDPRAFVVSAAVAASASFSTPIGYQTNTYVYGVGNYRFSDFARIGIPLNLLCFAVSVVLIPLFWPF
ncbi:MAG: SLC13 family permease [Opitutales bacterium]|nr:SLC13 family permease [Opitutales bacterium]